MKSLSPNTKIDFRKLLATVHRLTNSTNRFGSGVVKTYIYEVDEVLFRTDRCWAVAS